MLPMKLFKKQSSACNLLSLCAKRTKDVRSPVPLFNATCHEVDHPTGPINAVAAYWRQRFEAEGVLEPVESIEHIKAHIIRCNKETEFQEMEFDELQLERLKVLCRNID